MAVIFAKEAPLGIVPITSIAVTLVLIGYVVYQRYLHPLAKFPGPFMASLTDLWQVHQFLTLKQPYNLTKLHEKYGPIVRYGPDKLSIVDESAVSLIYQKGARTMPKTEFYDAFAGAHPSVFSMKDEAQYSVRRKVLSQGFSTTYIKELEPYLDANVELLRQKLDSYSSTNESFDLKEALHHYLIDALGELAFGEAIGVQASGDKSKIPPTAEPSLLASTTGAWPLMTKVLKKWLPLIPQQKVQQLFKGKQACAFLASKNVQRRMADIGEKKSGGYSGRKDFLSNLITAKDPCTGDFLSQSQIEAEAFGFIIAGTHITTATACLLFYHLLHAPEVMSKCVAEVAANLPPLQDGQSAYSLATAESSLPYLQQCVKENFRINPVVTFPLARRLLAPEGMMIGHQHIPQGTSIGICNHAFHHNPKIWGADHNVFDPSRWDNKETAAKSNLLVHFSTGGRQCIGRAVAMTSIYKLASTILKTYELELSDETERRLVMEGDFVGRLPSLVSHGLSSLEGPITVRVRKRNVDPRAT